jgi:hypothetical protein
MENMSALFFFAIEFISCREFIEDRFTRQAFCGKPDPIAVHIPQQAPSGFIDRGDVAQVDCLFQSRGTLVRRFPAVFERRHTRAAQFPGNPESQMAPSLVCLDSDHAICRTSMRKHAGSQSHPDGCD